MMNEYKAKPGAPINDDDAKIIGPAIERLIEKASGGILQPDIVVEDARRPTSPLHKYFDWDDSDAADKWRTHQARMMICWVTVVVKDSPKAVSVRAFYNVHDVPEENSDEDRQRGYVTLENVMDNEEYRRQVVAGALREVEGWSERYHAYNELRPVTRVVDAFVKEWRKEQDEQEEIVKAKEKAKA